MFPHEAAFLSLIIITLLQTHTHTRAQKHAVFTHVDLNGVGRHSPDKTAGEGSLRRSVLWKLWETVLLDDVSTGVQIPTASVAVAVNHMK